MTERIVEVLIPLMIPLQGSQPAPPETPSAGGPEDVFGFLYWLMTRQRKKLRKRKLVPSRKAQRLLKMLQALDNIRTLQLARQTGIMSA